MQLVFLFILGIITGSFLNVLALRLPKGESIWGRSRCDKCHKTLQWYDLVPLLSFVFSLGKCRYCKTPISPSYFFIELATGLLFVWFDRILDLIILGALIVIFIADLKYMTVPDIVAWPAMALVIVLYPENWLGALLAAGFFALFVLVSRETWMGWGDVEIAFIMGFMLGFPEVIFALTLAFWLGAIVGVILIIKNKKNLKSAIPFGPFLIIATILTLKLGFPLDFFFNL